MNNADNTFFCDEQSYKEQKLLRRTIHEVFELCNCRSGTDIGAKISIVAVHTICSEKKTILVPYKWIES